ncbi:MAG: hypothetical protein ACKVJU_13875 [Verrucomicrobiales bacterium]
MNSYREINAFPTETDELREMVQEAELDIAALTRPLQSCDFAKCRGTCCHDGVYVSSEEAAVIRNLDSADLESVGLTDLPEKRIVYGNWKGLASGPKTATRPAPMKTCVSDYPAHFEETNCIFLLPDARCALQALSMKEGKRPWYYKPLTCWIHPLAFAAGPDGKTILTLHDEENDPHNLPDYDGFVSKTHCGRTCSAEVGNPAFETLRGELEMLGEIGSRDLLSEIVEKI